MIFEWLSGLLQMQQPRCYIHSDFFHFVAVAFPEKIRENPLTSGGIFGIISSVRKY